ncbi:MAG: 50S ribosomal protein L21 [Planctomycetes bacterium]|nr:50S ribosomal protein L21 [Planctomycetota bacterium]
MYAIIEDSGKQFKVAQGETIFVDVRQLGEDQKELEFDRVLFYRDDEAAVIGQPIVEGAKAVGTIKGIAAGPKLYPLNFRRRKNSQRRIGHRQKYIEVEITDITRP